MVRHASELEGTAASFREAHDGPKYSPDTVNQTKGHQTPFRSLSGPLLATPCPRGMINFEERAPQLPDHNNLG